jgi:thiazole/oxazole-forming peptide maturase SagD family component
MSESHTDDSLHRLFQATRNRYSLLGLSDDDCPVCCLAALPKDGTGDGDSWLPPAARPAYGKAAMGRGFNRTEAALSCLGEAAELVSACYWGDERLIFADRRHRGGRFVGVDELVQLSDEQRQRRQEWDRRLNGIARLPDIDDRAEEWIQASCLTDGQEVLVPAAYAFIGYPEPDGLSQSYVGNSSGCAASGRLEDATVAGFLELVERDAAAIWWYGKHLRGGIDLTGLAFAEQVRSWLKSRARTCDVVDISTDLEIPACAAVSVRDDSSGLVLGFAADFNAQRAIEKAVTELVQLTLVTDLEHAHAQPASRGAGKSQAHGHGFLQPAIEHSWQNGPETSFANISVQTCIDLCKRHDLDLIAVDLTRPTVNIPVVRVIVPGLRQTLPAFGPGRLFDVPDRLGWQHQLTEKDLNPQPLPC